MEITAIKFWIIFGGVLMFAEILLPGLISVFLGLGALTVALLLYFDNIPDIPFQLITWFISSTVYIFSLRLLVMKYYPMDTVKESIDEDQEVFGRVVKVAEKLVPGELGRIEFGETTWQACTEDDDENEISVGENVEVIGRKNITWVVKKAE